MTEQKPLLSILSFLGFQVNAAIEKGHGNKILFNDVYKGLEERNLFELLDEKLPRVLDLSLFLERNEGYSLEQRDGQRDDGYKSITFQLNGKRLPHLGHLLRRQLPFALRFCCIRS